MKCTVDGKQLRELVAEAAQHAGRDAPRNAVTLLVEKANPHRLHVSASDTLRAFTGLCGVEEGAKPGQAHLAPAFLASVTRLLDGPVDLELTKAGRLRLSQPGGVTSVVPSVVEVESFTLPDWDGYEMLDAERVADALKGLGCITPVQWPGAQVFEGLKDSFELIQMETGFFTRQRIRHGQGSNGYGSVPLPASLLPIELQKRLAGVERGERGVLRWCERWYGYESGGWTWCYRSQDHVLPEGTQAMTSGFVEAGVRIGEIDTARLSLALKRAAAVVPVDKHVHLQLQVFEDVSYLSVCAGPEGQRSEDRFVVDVDDGAELDAWFYLPRLQRMVGVCKGLVEMRYGSDALTLEPDPDETYVLMRVHHVQ